MVARRRTELDFLRCIAILLVLGAHPLAATHTAGVMRPLAGLLVHLGWTGVDLFFVLSGFLVGGLLFNELKQSGKLDVKRFILRRGFKIWPCYYIFLILMAGVLLVQHTEFGYVLRSLLPNLLHIQNYADISKGPDGVDLSLSHVTLAHTWSLAVEEHFYLLLPLLLLVMHKRLSLFPIIVVGVCVLCFAIRLTHLGQAFSNNRNLWPTHLRIDTLFVGVLLAWMFHTRPDLWQRWTSRPLLLLVTGLVLIAPMCVLKITSPLAWTIGYSWLAAGYACILSACVAWSDRTFFTFASVRALASLGVYSYPTYLFIMSFGRWPAKWTAQHFHGATGWLISMVVYFLTAFTVGIIFSKLIEIPTLRLREKLFPSRTGSPSPVG
jgi:peptidoglycan/LPS O-acetylase OafA/YrhL